MITLSLDVTLLLKERFKKVKRQSGKEAVFCDLILIETPSGKYGDFMVKQNTTKEERAAKLDLPILGNAKYVGGPSSEPRQAREPSQSTPPPNDQECPF